MVGSSKEFLYNAKKKNYKILYLPRVPVSANGKLIQKIKMNERNDRKGEEL